MIEVQPTILLVEDDENDQLFIRRAFRQYASPVNLVTVGNGEEAIAYLKGTGPYDDRVARPLPSLIITDLKMPKLDGIEFLSWLSRHEDFRLLPAVVLTSSNSRDDISLAFQYGAKGYMIKPVDFSSLRDCVKTIVDYWRISCVPYLPVARTPG
jgi:CheY-like chemotaxis protein